MTNVAKEFNEIIFTSFYLDATVFTAVCSVTEKMWGHSDLWPEKWCKAEVSWTNIRSELRCCCKNKIRFYRSLLKKKEVTLDLSIKSTISSSSSPGGAHLSEILGNPAPRQARMDRTSPPVAVVEVLKWPAHRHIALYSFLTFLPLGSVPVAMRRPVVHDDLHRKCKKGTRYKHGFLQPLWRFNYHRLPASRSAVLTE